MASGCSLRFSHPADPAVLATTTAVARLAMITVLAVAPESVVLPVVALPEREVGHETMEYVT
jgi:hypothetical protein